MPPKRKVERKYEDAFWVDFNRLTGEYEKLEAVLKSKPSDAKALAARAKLKPFLAAESVEARLANARKMDKAGLHKILDTFTF
jgi:bifunctional DNase/RNase